MELRAWNPRCGAVVTALLVCGISAAAAPVVAAPGDLDPSFGAGGRVLTGFPYGVAPATGAALQPDGKIVVVGAAVDANHYTYFALARYLGR